MRINKTEKEFREVMSGQRKHCLSDPDVQDAFINCLQALGLEFREEGEGLPGEVMTAEASDLFCEECGATFDPADANWQLAGWQHLCPEVE